MKKIIMCLLISIMVMVLTGCSSNNANNYKKEDYGIFDIYDLFKLQKAEEYEYSNCLSCLESIEVTDDICKGQGSIIIDGKNVTLSDALNHKLFTIEQVECLVNNNVVKHYRIPYIFYKIGEIIYSIIKGL